jgi:GT2 family glycosyltransferase
MKTEVSIIIVNYNCEEHVCNCIDSIYRNTKGTGFEIIVVDNASVVYSIEAIGKRFPGVKVIVNEENLGFGAANNIGAREALGKYLFFLNPDTLLLNDAVSVFFHFMEESKNNVASCGGKLLNRDGSLNKAFGHFPSVLQQFSDLGFYKFYKRYYYRKLTMGKGCDFKVIRLIDYIVGAAFCIKKQVFDEMNGFDERFFLYYEETDLFFRLHKAGYKSYLLPEIEIIHLEGVTTLSGEPFNYGMWEMMEKSRYYYFNKNRGWFISYCVRGIQLVWLVSNYLFGGVRIDLKRAVGITLRA